MLALQRAHQGVLQDKNGIDGNLLDPTVRSEQLPPNSSNLYRFVSAQKNNCSWPLSTQKGLHPKRATKIIDGLYQFFE
jgi:hypothetical protein